MNDEDELRKDIVSLAEKYGRYEYSRIRALLKAESWRVYHGVEKIWSEEGLKVHQKQKNVEGYASTISD